VGHWERPPEQQDEDGDVLGGIARGGADRLARTFERKHATVGWSDRDHCSVFGRLG
jgi:hypothetical protein